MGILNTVCSVVNFVLAQNSAQKNETFVLLAIFALVACAFIAGNFAKTPFTKEKKVQKPLLVIAFMMLFVFLVVYLIFKFKN